jgi:Flp pilus assembly pilin Flp
VILVLPTKERPIPNVLAGINELLHIHEVHGLSHERRRSIASNQDGQTMAEYAFILAGVALLATAAYMTLGQTVLNLFSPIVNAV